MRSIKIITVAIGALFTHYYLSAQNFNEILGRPTNVSMTISILFDQVAEVYWEYGVSQGIYTQNTITYTTVSATPLEADFSNLTPDTKYYYRTRYRPAGSTSSFLAGTEHSFHTQRATGSTFTFTVNGDEHLCDKKGVANLLKITLANQAQDHPDFMLSMGDNFGNDHFPFTITSQELDSLHKMYRPLWGNICHSVPLFLCLGNHEGEKDYYLALTPPNNIAVWGTLWRKFYYPNPYPNNFYSGDTAFEPYGIGNPENYYAWTWGNALFVVMDVYRHQCDTSAKPKLWNWSLGYPEYAWLKNTLENSTAQNKFVFAHHTRGEGRGGVTTAAYYEWGGYEANGTTWGFTTHRPGWAKPIQQLFVDNGVNIFFQGHDHLFAHELLNGVTYQEVPMAADSTYKIGMLANADAYVSDTLDGSGHIRVTVYPACIKVDYIRAYLPADTVSGLHHNREVAFSYTIGNCPPAGIEDPVGYTTVRVYPNPAVDRLTIVLPEDSGNLQIDLVNTLGQHLLQTSAKEIDVRSIPDGMYFIHIRTEKLEVVNKVIIQK